jgi:hypothetical protein
MISAAAERQPALATGVTSSSTIRNMVIESLFVLDLAFEVPS